MASDLATSSGARQPGMHMPAGIMRLLLNSGFRKRGRRSGVASDFFRFLPFFSVSISFFFPFFFFRVPIFSLGSKQKGPAEQVAPRVSSLKFCSF